MKILLLLILFSIQVFSAEPLTAREKSNFASMILDTFSSSSQKVMEDLIVNVLGEINPDNAAKVVELAIDKLRNYEGPITPSYVKGMIVGIDAGVKGIIVDIDADVSASGAHDQAESQSIIVSPNIPAQQPSDDQQLITDGSSAADSSITLDTAIESEQDPEQTTAVDADLP